MSYNVYYATNTERFNHISEMVEQIIEDSADPEKVMLHAESIKRDMKEINKTKEGAIMVSLPEASIDELLDMIKFSKDKETWKTTIEVEYSPESK